MADTPSDKSSRGRWRGLSDWFKKPAGSEAVATPVSGDTPSRIGHYAITGKLGEGGMGVVYEARDERLERRVALKTMASLTGDDTARRRFWREARAAASVNHPNVCQMYEIGEDGGELFIAMELLEGESLAERLKRGPLDVAEALPIGLGILAALAALHERGVIHRDLKPSNVFLTPHGVKLLDFGLARTTESELATSMVQGDLTRTGIVMGTPRFMAPEQAMGQPIDGRTDLFAAGAILFEMLSGRPAFTGRTVIEILHATLHEQPPALTGSPAVAAIDRVIRRALAKRPEDRPASAEAMAAELRGVVGDTPTSTPAIAQTLTRLVVLPFRVLRPDPDTDFLAVSLPDAIATSLSRFTTLIVRSRATAAKFGDAPDLKVLAGEADVDRVVMGTLLRAGEQVQVAAQLVEAPSGTLLTSHTVLASLGDLFRLQDDITRRIVETMALPLGGAAGSPSTPDVPHDPGAYGLYLRANALARSSYEQLPQARDLYQRCVELDPSYAPAWAELGRCHRVIGKFIDPSGDSEARAEQALRRALELNPRLAVAHKFYAALEADTGHARTALTRLLGQAQQHGNDPELFAGLVHACRYCGLYDQSISAHKEARRLDLNIPTSLELTLLLMGNVERLINVRRAIGYASEDDMLRVIGLGLAGRLDESRQLLNSVRQATQITAIQSWMDFLEAWLDRDPARMIVRREKIQLLRIMEDPEAIFQEAWLYCDAGGFERGLGMLERAVERGYYAAPALQRASQFDALRADPRFQKLLADAVAGRDLAQVAFREGGGERLLGV